MGRRSAQTTKSGRFMNPADQQRKAERAKELKRNKKQRTLVRHTIMKNRDPDDVISQIRAIDDQEMETDGPIRVSANDKREKLRKAYKEIRDFHQKEGQADKVKEIDHKMQVYEAECHRKRQQMAAIKFSMTGDMDAIPMPEGPVRINAAMTPFLPSYAIGAAPGPFGPPPPRKRRIGGKTFRPPGPPVGIPPDFSDSEDEFGREDEEDADALHDDNDFAPVEIPDEIMDELNPHRRDEHPPAPPRAMIPPPFPMVNLAHAPPLHPSMLPPPPRMPLRMAPPPPMAVPQHRESATISAGPTVSSKASITAEATISAKPELRDLTRESAQFVPTSMRVRRDGDVKKPIVRTNAMGIASVSAAKHAAKTTDDAYADFMKEMDGLL